MKAAHLRLSDGRSWAWEFTAASADELSDQCLEAWALCPLKPLPLQLELHVRDAEVTPHHWVHADFSENRVIRRPDTATASNNWGNADWAALWATVQRTVGKSRELAIFLGAVDGFAAGIIDRAAP